MSRRRDQSGFTIIELLIATMVFTVVLMICLVSISRIGKMYYKGVTQANSQEVIRNLSEEVVREIQFGAQAPSSTLPVTGVTGGSVQRFCIGGWMYRAVMNRSLNPPTVPTVLKRAKLAAACPSTATFDATMAASTDPDNGELATPNMRLLKLSIVQGANNLWTVQIRVALGDSDLLQFTDPVHPDNAASYETAICKSSAGSQFCSASELDSTIVRRID